MFRPDRHCHPACSTLTAAIQILHTAPSMAPCLDGAFLFFPDVLVIEKTLFVFPRFFSAIKGAFLSWGVFGGVTPAGGCLLAYPPGPPSTAPAGRHGKNREKKSRQTVKNSKSPRFTDKSIKLSANCNIFGSHNKNCA